MTVVLFEPQTIGSWIVVYLFLMNQEKNLHQHIFWLSNEILSRKEELLQTSMAIKNRMHNQSSYNIYI